jgi:3D (Asp-Asp-Asp) domain-containing protein
MIMRGVRNRDSLAGAALTFAVFALAAALVVAAVFYAYTAYQRGRFLARYAQFLDLSDMDGMMYILGFNEPQELLDVRDRLAREEEEFYGRAALLRERVEYLNDEVEWQRLEYQAMLDLVVLNRHFNMQELIDEFDRYAPLTAHEMIGKQAAYEPITYDEVVEKYGDVFGRQFTSSTTVYVDVGRTASGRFTRGGTIAVDRRVVPLGTRMLNLQLGRLFSADDTGGAVHGTITDIFINDTVANAFQWGRRNTDWVLIDNAKLRARQAEALAIVGNYAADPDAAASLLAKGRAEVADAVLRASFREETDEVRLLRERFGGQ